MEHLRLPPEKMYRRYKINLVYPLTFVDILRPHLNVHPYLGYLSSLDEYCLKNIWNHVVKLWQGVHKTLSENKAFCKSKYRKLWITTRSRVTINELDECLKEFINSDKFLALFVINAIQDYLYPV
jgi:hypothetical protein